MPTVGATDTERLHQRDSVVDAPSPAVSPMGRKTFCEQFVTDNDLSPNRSHFAPQVNIVFLVIVYLEAHG